MRRITRRAVIVSGVGVLLVGAGATAQAGWLFVIAAGVLGLVAGSFLLAHHLGSVGIRRTVPSRFAVGDTVPVTLEIESGRRSSVPLTRLEDGFEAIASFSLAVDRLPAGATGTFQTLRTATKRGHYTDGPIRLSTGAPFGFLRSSKALDVPTRCVVEPRWVGIRDFPLTQTASYARDSDVPSRRVGAGEEYLSVREYRAGDPRRMVHWRSTARTGRLMVREHEQQASMPVALVIAGGEVGEGDGSTYETLVSAAASVGIFALAGGHPVSLTVPESHGWVTRRIEGRTHLLDELARLKALDTSLSDAMQSGDDSHSVGTTVVFIPSAGLAARSLPEVTAALKRAGSSVIAVLAEVSSWDDKVADDVDIARLRETCAVRRLAYKQELEVCLAD